MHALACALSRLALSHPRTRPREDEAALRSWEGRGRGRSLEARSGGDASTAAEHSPYERCDDLGGDGRESFSTSDPSSPPRPFPHPLSLVDDSLSPLSLPSSLFYTKRSTLHPSHHPPGAFPVPSSSSSSFSARPADPRTSSVQFPRTSTTRTTMSNEQIPKSARAVVFDECNGAIRVDKDHAVTQPNELKAGEALVKVEYTGVCRASNLSLHSVDEVVVGGGRRRGQASSTPSTLSLAASTFAPSLPARRSPISAYARRHRPPRLVRLFAPSS